MFGWHLRWRRILSPRFSIVDEVLAVGDSEFQRKCLGKMHEVSTKDGRTVLFVSHNMAAVESMCGSALLLVGGQSAAQGSTAKVVGEYLRDLSRIASLPLRDRTDRSGSGELRFVSMILESPGRICRLGISMRRGCSFAPRRGKSYTSRELRSLEMSLGIDNEAGQRVALVDTMLVGA